MLVIGLILVLAALVTIGFMWFGTAGLDPVEVDLGAFTATLTPLWLFLLGATCVLVLAVGVALLAAGLRRRQRQRRELKELRRKAEVLDRDPRVDDRDRAGDATTHDRIVRDDSADRGDPIDREDPTDNNHVAGREDPYDRPPTTDQADSAAPAEDQPIHLPEDRRRPVDGG